MTSRLTETVESLLDWGLAKATSLSDSIKEVLVTIEGSTDDDGTEEIPDQPLSVVAAVIERPRAPDGDSGFEVMFVRRGDEAIPIATRDVRDLPTDIEAGEVIIRDLGGGGNFLRLKPDGSSVFVTSGLSLGTASATEKMTLGTTLKSFLDQLKIWMDSHTHPHAMGATSAPSAPSPTVPTIESSKHTLD